MWDTPINPDSDDFRWFLVWLVDDKDFTASEIISAMYESHKYKYLMNEYLKEGDE
tara:strand:+ start:131 stop:295 length:165 start_codon:yes stop_codon:yes gene_type:complete